MAGVVGSSKKSLIVEDRYLILYKRGVKSLVLFMSMLSRLPSEEDINKHFVQMTKPYRALKIAMSAADKGHSVGIIYFGAGGYGKTEFANFVGKKVSSSCLVVNCGSNTSVEQLYGGLQGKRWLEDGEILYNYEKSLLNAEYLILDEGLSLPEKTLTNLRGVLQSKEAHQDGKIHKFNVKMPIITTNVIPSEWVNGALTDSEKQSRGALIQRFVYCVKVEWEDHSPKAWYELLDKVLGIKDSTYADVCARLFELRPYVISPRTAIKTYGSYVESGLEPFQYMEGITPEMMESLKINAKNAKKKAETFDALSRIEAAITYYKSTMDSPISLETLADVSKGIFELEKEMSTLVSDEDLSSLMTTLSKKIKVEKGRVMDKLNAFGHGY